VRSVDDRGKIVNIDQARPESVRQR